MTELPRDGRLLTLNRPKTNDILNVIYNILETREGWFISGSYADRLIKNPRDIDVYFSDESVAKTLLDNIKSSTFRYEKALVVVDKPGNTISVTPRGLTLPIKFCLSSIGDAQAVVDTFDINVSKKAVFPDGTYWEDPTADNPVHIDRVYYDTFSRFFKYLILHNPNLPSGELPHVSKCIIDTFINNDDKATCYYGKNPDTYVNEQLFKYFTHKTTIFSRYMLNQALKHSPSLLV